MSSSSDEPLSAAVVLAGHLQTFSGILDEARAGVCEWNADELDRAHKWACGVEKSVRRLDSHQCEALQQQLGLGKSARKLSKQPDGNLLTPFRHARRTFLRTVLSSPFFFNRPVLSNWFLNVYRTDAETDGGSAPMLFEVGIHDLHLTPRAA
jgi:hypothetical protein